MYASGACKQDEAVLDSTYVGHDLGGVGETARPQCHDAVGVAAPHVGDDLENLGPQRVRAHADAEARELGAQLLPEVLEARGVPGQRPGADDVEPRGVERDVHVPEERGWEREAVAEEGGGTVGERAGYGLGHRFLIWNWICFLGWFVLFE